MRGSARMIARWGQQYSIPTNMVKSWMQKTGLGNPIAAALQRKRLADFALMSLVFAVICFAAGVFAAGLGFALLSTVCWSQSLKYGSYEPFFNDLYTLFEGVWYTDRDAAPPYDYDAFFRLSWNGWKDCAMYVLDHLLAEENWTKDQKKDLKSYDHLQSTYSRLGLLPGQ